MGFWEGLLEFGSFLDLISDDTFEKYKNSLYDSFAKNENKLYGNFSKDGFDIIFELLIGNASESIIIFCKNYDVIFNDSNFLLLKFIAEKFVRVKGDVVLYTFNGFISEKFKELEKEYSSVKYIPCKTNFNEVKINNMIIVDNKRYWLEDTVFDRNTLDNPIKACVNFNDVRKCLELLKFISDVRMKCEIN